MNDLKIQGMFLLLIGVIALPTGWCSMLISDNMFTSLLSIIVFTGGVGAFAFGYLFVKVSLLLEDR